MTRDNIDIQYTKEASSKRYILTITHNYEGVVGVYDAYTIDDMKDVILGLLAEDSHALCDQQSIYDSELQRYMNVIIK